VNTRTRDVVYPLYKNTPFMNACFYGQLEAVRFLSTVPGIDVNAVVINLLHADRLGNTGLHHVVGHLPIVQFLLSSDLGFDVKVRNRDGWSALLVACWSESLDVVEYLLTTHNANIHAIDGFGKSCLHLAVECRRVEVARCLLANYPGADFVTKTDNGGSTPLHYSASFSGGLEIAQLLLENGAHVNAINNHGRSPLHWAARSGYQSLAVIQEFIRNGAVLLATDKNGDTPFDLARTDGRDYILTVAYKDQVVEYEGNRSIHSILEIAEYCYVVEEDEWEDEDDPVP